MKHIWVVEVSGGRKWRPSGSPYAMSLFSKKLAEYHAYENAKSNPGLKFRVAKYVREAK